MGMDRHENGVLLLEKPGRMRWNYAAPPGKVFVLDGKFRWSYTPGDVQVQQIPAKKLDDLRSPLRFLLGHAQLTKELNGLTMTPGDRGEFRLRGVPKGMEQRRRLTLVVPGSARMLHPLLLFVDADVRLAPEGAARAAAFLAASGADLASGIPRQETVTFLERLLLPLIHFVLLGFLPLGRMRASRHPAYGAGCGQLFLTTRAAYAAMGGHGAIRSSLHDGVALPRAFRRAGLATDLFDATGIATCRMYRSAGEVWRGLAKNATEGLAAPEKIVPATLLLLAGQAMPPLLALLALLGRLPLFVLIPAGIGTAAAYFPRLIAVRRFRQPLDGALLHPLAIAVFLLLQWMALGRRLLGRPAGWKGRTYAPAPSPRG